MDKSFVTMEQKQCILCGNTYDTNAILLDRGLKNRFDMHTTTGLGLCPEHDKSAEDYVILIEIDSNKSNISDDKIKPQDAYKTGAFAHIKKDAFERLFNVPASPIQYVEEGLLAKLNELQEYPSPKERSNKIKDLENKEKRKRGRPKKIKVE